MTEAVRLDPKNIDAFCSRSDAWRRNARIQKRDRRRDRSDPDRPARWLGLLPRALAMMLAHEGNAVGGFREIIEIQGWKGEHVPYAVILGSLAAHASGDQAAANALLGESAGKLDEAAWPCPAIKYLRGEIDEAALLALAVDDENAPRRGASSAWTWQSKARSLRRSASLRWVLEHGNREFFEYGIAAAELERLTGPNALATPAAPVQR